MEPVSLAIGLVPIALNVIELSRNLLGKIATYKSAATEIQDIIDRMEIIVEMCKRLENDENAPQHHRGIRARVLHMCYSRVLSIQTELENVANKEKGPKQGFEWLRKKSGIDKLLLGLNDSVTMLNTFLNWSVATSPNFQMKMIAMKELPLEPNAPTSLLPCAPSSLEPHNISLPDPGATLLPEPSVSPEHLPISSTTTARGPIQPTVTRNKSTAYRNSLYIYSTSDVSKMDKGNVGETQHRSYLFGVPLFGVYFSLTAKRGPFSPWSITLDTPRFIYEEEDKALFDKIRLNAPGSNSTPSEIAHWLQKHRVSANTQLVSMETKSKGRSILRGARESFFGEMIASNNQNLVKFLIDQGGPALEDEQLFSGVFGGESRAGLLDKDIFIDPAYIYARMRGPLLTMAEYSELVELGESFKFIETMFETCRDCFFDDYQDFLNETYFALAGLYGSSSRIMPLPDQSSSYLISKLLASGLDANQTFAYCRKSFSERHYEPHRSFSLGIPRQTVLHRMLQQGRTGVEDTLQGAEKWLECFEGSSISIDDYLKVELDMELKALGARSTLKESHGWDRMSIRDKLEAIFDIIRPAERLASWVEAEHPGFIVPAFRYGYSTSVNLSRNQDEPTHYAWKQARVREQKLDFISMPWPFLKETNTELTMIRGCKYPDEWTAKALDAYDYYIRLLESRAERRQVKKWNKLIKKANLMEGERPMPGAWQMDWWEYQGAW